MSFYIIVYRMWYDGMINELPTKNVKKNEDGLANQFPEDQMSKLTLLLWASIHNFE